MKLNVYSVEKNDEYKYVTDEYVKKISAFAKIKDETLFNKTIAAAQKISSDEAKQSYSKVLSKYLSSGYNIALDVEGKELDSYRFSEVICDKSTVNFFIAGAYGWESSFLEKCDKIISLSKLTMSHKIAKIVLYEQIYRGLSIINNHPYHKI
jgi:23S rRNA (pseudouridine1915-N3)-methyltransferase